MRSTATFLLFAAISCPRMVHATPSEAAALGALDMVPGSSLDTYAYLDNDLNIFTNPALAHQYTNQVQVNLGHAGGGLWEGTGLNPRGVVLVAIDDDTTLGLVLNRPTTELGEEAALRPVLQSNLSGYGGGLSGQFVDPVSQAGLAFPQGAVGLAPPVDLFFARDLGSMVVGANLYAAFGQSRSDNVSESGPDQFARNRFVRRSSWVTLNVGLASTNGIGFKPEAWVKYTGVSSWADVQNWLGDSADDWQPEDAIADSTVGLKGTMRLGAGFRGTIPGDTIDVVPLVMVDYARGTTFANDRMFNDPDALTDTLVVRAEDDLIASSTLLARGGVGVVYKANEQLKVIGAAHLQGQLWQRVTDNRAEDLELPGSVKQRTQTGTMTLNLPVLNVGAEYFPYDNFGIRGGMRSAAAVNSARSRTRLYAGEAGSEFELGDADVDSVSSNSLGSQPGLTGAFGPSIKLGDATIDAVIGGAFVGAGGDLFSRVDARMEW